MTQPLSEMFLAQDTDTVNHRGRIVKALARVPVSDGATVTVTRLRVGASRHQALKLALNKGVLDVNGHRAPAVALWSHTSPETVTLTVRGEHATTLDVWNAWSMGGVDSSWVGNAGMVSKSTASGLVLRCSDGIGPAEFSDLEVEVSVDKP